jgi:hypothetical protein
MEPKSLGEAPCCSRRLSHIPGIGKLTEQGLWEHGIRSWDDADRFEKRFGVLGARLQKKAR